MDSRSLLWLLHEMPGIGWKTIRRLVDACGKELTLLLSMEKEELMKLGLNHAKAELLMKGLRGDGMEARLSEYRHAGIGWMTVWDSAYPPLLKQIAQPPWVLYYMGNPGLLQRPCVAMVGTRTPTVYGRKAAESLARSLSASGLCLVSGLARGIDSAVHRGALEQPGGTAAVLGCGIGEIYPPENESLFREIAASGVIVSEYPMGTPPHPGLFSQRNRIIAGLSMGTVVVEAAERSGSLITADLALEESRDVFAVPGNITSPKSRGTLKLIRQGAILVTSADDILQEYMHMITTPESPYSHRTPPVMLTPDEQKICDLLAGGPLSIDELLEKSQINFGLLHSVLLSLTLKNVIEPLPGSTYSVL